MPRVQQLRDWFDRQAASSSRTAHLVVAVLLLGCAALFATIADETRWWLLVALNVAVGALRLALAVRAPAEPISFTRGDAVRGGALLLGGAFVALWVVPLVVMLALIYLG